MLEKLGEMQSQLGNVHARPLTSVNGHAKGGVYPFSQQEQHEGSPCSSYPSPLAGIHLEKKKKPHWQKS